VVEEVYVFEEGESIIGIVKLGLTSIPEGRQYSNVPLTRNKTHVGAFTTTVL
jgi:hypothetical protein